MSQLRSPILSLPASRAQWEPFRSLIIVCGLRGRGRWFWSLPRLGLIPPNPTLRLRVEALLTVVVLRHTRDSYNELTSK